MPAENYTDGRLTQGFKGGPGWWKDYSLALALVGVALVTARVLSSALRADYHYEPLYFALLVAAVLARPAAVVAATMAGVLGSLTLLYGNGTGRSRGSDDIVMLWLFVGFGLVATALAVHLRRQKERTLKVQQAHEVALRAADLGTFDWNPDTGIVTWDERAQAHLKTSAREMVFSEFLARVPKDDRPIIEALINHPPQTNGFSKVEYRILWPDKSVHWIGASCHSLFDAAASPLPKRVIGTVSNIDPQKEREASLQEEAHLAKLRADANQGLQQADCLQSLLQSTVALLVERLHAAFARIWTMDASGEWLELQASAGMYTHLNGPHSRVRVGALKIGRIARTCEPHVTNEVIGDPNVPEQEWARREGLVSFAGFPLLSEGHVLGVLGLFASHSLTPAAVGTLGSLSAALGQAIGRKKAEEALASAQDDLARVNAGLETMVKERTSELEAFCYSLSHDMRAPLRAIQSFAAILQAEHGHAITDLGNKYIDMVITAAQRLDRLIRDVLTFSRLSQRPVARQSVDPEKVIRTLLHEHAEFQPPRADIQVASHLPRVVGDENSLYQCFAKLLDNAVKFVPPGTHPQVRIWSEEPGNNSVRLCIEDNGIGIEPDAQGRIFNLFERYHDRPEFAGSGIGLAIVQRAAQQMGAEVGVQSAPGKGSCFWLELARAA